MKPLVLVHGFMGGSAQWASQGALGQRRDLICLDLPGFGKNAGMAPVNSIPAFAEWVLAELTQRGVKRFDLLGHSMGGMIVQEMTRLAPGRVDRLVLYGTGAVGVLPGRFESIETSMRRARADGATVTARRIAATWFLRREAAAEFPACAAIAEESGLPAILAGLEAMQEWSGLGHLASITAPTLVLWGDCDRTYPWPQVERLWQSIPTCNLAVVPACAHAVHLERPRLFNQLVSGFLGED
ncbi:MAG: alpha/beta hydrolase [Rhodobacter sp.]|nr:alpha/beta hydrolase [Rhodobacter sp.]